MTQFSSALCLAVLAFLGLALQASATNLVTNGDFESGNTGFSSDYIFSSDLGPEGRYSVVSDASDVHPSFMGLPYFGNKFFVGNGGPDVNAAVWRSQVIQVTQPGVAYRFEAQISSMVWVTNQEYYDGPDLFFEIGNGTNWTPLGSTISLQDGTPPGYWFLTFADGAFGQAGDYYIQLRNNSSVLGGNDFGIDSVFFGLRTDAPSYLDNPGDANPTVYNPAGVPEPGAGALIMLGLGSLIALRRARRSAV